VKGGPFLLSLGSNLGDRSEHLRNGIDFLKEHMDVERVSQVVESAPWGPVPQPDFLNVVVRGRTERSPAWLLRMAQASEANEGRDRGGPRWGPRTLDVDLIFIGEMRLRSVRLVLPHPHWKERGFVRWLISEVAGEMVDPASGRSLSEFGGGPAPEGIRPLGDISALPPEVR
jgi:2-amino-4-hydroxy-6-hydroxymethyldihydropteridine diphosphokinase